eukprot:CAMPEP_0116144274 /NCGR_PEP_ID=MMETSP0329-20121206/15920_1 /TAXON_ID=697910 /ORGANISM="Pseudo-nitzschia arenysensis, Strain B593" /LENGTH=604 /DNA_ID=CAMNT_0003639697 /DNA_START=187 /DNA_END=2001 /DNA_ORIENTATION=+
MDSTDDSSSSAMKISSSSSDNNVKRFNESTLSIALPPSFVSDPAAFLTSIASRPSPSPEGISLLAGPLSEWFRKSEESCREIGKLYGQGASVHPASHVAHLYLCAAATQLREEPLQGITASTLAAVTMGATSVSTAAADIAASVLSREPQENSSRVSKDRDETMEAVAAAAVLCPDKSAISSSGILSVLASLVTATSASNAGASSTTSTAALSNDNNKIASSIATSLLNIPSSSSKTFPPLTPAHTAFLQCAVLAEEYEFAETAIRGTWPLPTSDLKKNNGSINHESRASVSIIMRYYFLRGIVHYNCGRDHYAMAHRCWWTCLSIPVDTVSTIAIQAWKKLSLVQPLLDTIENNRVGGETSGADVVDMNNDGDSLAASSLGKNKVQASPVTRLPKCTPKGLSKSISALFDSSIGKSKQASTATGTEESQEKDVYSVYTQLGSAVEAVDRNTAESLVRIHGGVLAADGNMEMAQNCLRRVQELQVRKASTVFSVTSIHMLARRWKVTPDEASRQLSDAVESGVVPCRVEGDGTVVFLASTGSTTKNTLSDLTAWIKLLERLQRMDVDLSISSKYNTSKRKDDKGEAIGTTGPRGVEEFYSDPTM